MFIELLQKEKPPFLVVNNPTNADYNPNYFLLEFRKIVKHYNFHYAP
jgi:hypothetical protein